MSINKTLLILISLATFCLNIIAQLKCSYCENKSLQGL